MKKGLLHALSLVVAAALMGFLLPSVWKIGSGEWTARGGGSFYDPSYQRDLLHAIGALFVCDLVRQALRGRVMFVRLTVESILLIVGIANARTVFLPDHVMLIIIGGAMLALAAAVLEEVYAVARISDRNLT